MSDSVGLENPYVGKYTKMGLGLDDGFEAVSGLGANSQGVTPPAASGLDVGLKIRNGVAAGGSGSGNEWGFKDMFGGGVAGALGNIGSVLSGVGSVYDAYQKQKYQKKVFNMEKERVDRQLAAQKEASGVLSGIWK